MEPGLELSNPNPFPLVPSLERHSWRQSASEACTQSEGGQGASFPHTHKSPGPDQEMPLVNLKETSTERSRTSKDFAFPANLAQWSLTFKV